jgi:hypothetical protein
MLLTPTRSTLRPAASFPSSSTPTSLNASMVGPVQNSTALWPRCTPWYLRTLLLFTLDVDVDRQCFSSPLFEWQYVLVLASFAFVALNNFPNKPPPPPPSSFVFSAAATLSASFLAFFAALSSALIAARFAFFSASVRGVLSFLSVVFSPFFAFESFPSFPFPSAAAAAVAVASSSSSSSPSNASTLPALAATRHFAHFFPRASSFSSSDRSRRFFVFALSPLFVVVDADASRSCNAASPKSRRTAALTPSSPPPPLAAASTSLDVSTLRSGSWKHSTSIASASDEAHA